MATAAPFPPPALWLVSSIFVAKPAVHIGCFHHRLLSDNRMVIGTLDFDDRPPSELMQMLSLITASRHFV